MQAAKQDNRPSFIADVCRLRARVSYGKFLCYSLDLAGRELTMTQRQC